MQASGQDRTGTKRRKAGWRQWREADARRALEAHAKSGLSLTAFAEREGVNAERLSWWRRRLAEPSSRTRPERRGTSAVRLIPAVAVATPARMSAPVVVRLSEGVEIEMTDTAAVPAEWIASLVGGLRRSAP